MNTTSEPADEDVRAATGGDRAALERVVRAAQRRVYPVALRFFGEPEAARDATQEVLVKIVTRLGTFQGTSRFSTWAHTLAIRTFLDMRRSRTEELLGSEASFEALLSVGLDAPYEGPEAAVLREEVGLACSTAMLTTLSRELRTSYLLGEILDFSSDEAAAILEVDAATHRKRLSLARGRVQAFVGRVCGLVRDDAPCRCERRVRFGLATGLVDPERLRFAAAKNLRLLERHLDARALHRVAMEPPLPEVDVRELLRVFDADP